MILLCLSLVQILSNPDFDKEDGRVYDQTKDSMDENSKTSPLKKSNNQSSLDIIQSTASDSRTQSVSPSSDTRQRRVAPEDSSEIMRHLVQAPKQNVKHVVPPKIKLRRCYRGMWIPLKKFCSQVTDLENPPDYTIVLGFVAVILTFLYLPVANIRVLDHNH